MLILFVVFGHVVGAMAHTQYASAPVSRFFNAVYHAVYLFHMPAFFVVAGWLWKRFAGEPLRERFVQRAKRLIVPYFIWGFASAAVFVVSKSLVGGCMASGGYYNVGMVDFIWYRPFFSILHAGGWPDGEGFRCNSVLWFLPCMFVVLMAYDWIARLFASRRSKRLDIALFITGFIIQWFMPRQLPWGLSRAPSMLAFFAFGRLLRNGGFADRIKLRFILCCVGWVAVALIGWWCWRNQGLYFSSRKPQWFVYAAAAGVFGSVVSMVCARAVGGSASGCVLAKTGRYSLGIMLLHKFFLVFVQFLLFPVLAAHSIVVWSAVAVVATVSVAVLSFFAARFCAKALPFAMGE